MDIRQAEAYDLELVKSIAYKTIQTVYPRYYPPGAVDFFLKHHSQSGIAADIDLKTVYVLEDGKSMVGTVTVKACEICRLFVLPEHQGKGGGRKLLDFSERLIAKESDKCKLAASLASKHIYLKREYRTIAFHSILTDNGDYLCYDEMEKTLRKQK